MSFIVLRDIEGTWHIFGRRACAACACRILLLLADPTLYPETPWLADRPGIISLSLGQTRRFELRCGKDFHCFLEAAPKIDYVFWYCQDLQRLGHTVWNILKWIRSASSRCFSQRPCLLILYLGQWGWAEHYRITEHPWLGFHILFILFWGLELKDGDLCTMEGLTQKSHGHNSE
jgi:hypothetical protein